MGHRPIETFYQTDTFRVRFFPGFARGIIAALWILTVPSWGAWNCAGDGRREVCGDGSLKQSQSVLDELRLLDFAWTAKHGQLPAFTPPIQAMLYKSKDEFQPFQLISTGFGLFQSGPDRDWILILNQGDWGVRAARHEWVHRALYHTTPGLPLWLEEGLAEYWSTLETASGKVRIGKPPENHIELLADRPWLTARELFGVTKESEIYRDDKRAGMFYAQSWAVVHLLAQNSDWKGRLQAYLATLATGADPREAFRMTWSKDQAEAWEASRAWVKSSLVTSETIPLGTVADELKPRSRTLDETESLLMRAEALLAHSREEEAQTLIAAAAKRGGNRTGVVVARAFVALQRGDKQAALNLFDEAIEKGDRRGSVMLERAMLMRETGATRKVVRSALEAAVHENPGLAEGWHLLGNMAASSGDIPAAVDAAEKSVLIMPRQSIFWESLGRAYLAAGRPGDAGNAAAKAVLSARTDNERNLAEGLTRDVASWRSPEPVKASKSWFQIPDGWQGPKPDTSVNGRLVDVNCSGKTLLFTVETADKKRTVLRAADPSKIFLQQQEGHKREFVCGPQKPVLLVEAGYKEGTEASTKSAGELIVLAIQGAETSPPPAAPKQKPTPTKKQPAKQPVSPPKK